MPTDETLREKIIHDAHLEKRMVFFNSFRVLLICLGIAVGLSLIYFILVEFLANSLKMVIIILGMVVLLVVGVLLLFYGHVHTLQVVLCVILLITFFACLASLFMLKGSIKLGGLFLEEATRFGSHSRVSLIYIPLFMLLTWGFLIMVIKEYTGFVSVGNPSFSNDRLYYKPNSNGIYFTMAVLIVQLVWGLSFLKECCKCVPIQSTSAFPTTQSTTTSSATPACASSPTPSNSSSCTSARWWVVLSSTRHSSSPT